MCAHAHKRMLSAAAHHYTFAVMSDCSSGSEPDLKTLVNELHEARNKWRRIGIQLNIDPATLDSYKASDPGDLLCNMLQEWLRKASNTTWDEIILRHLDLVQSVKQFLLITWQEDTLRQAAMVGHSYTAV